VEPCHDLGQNPKPHSLRFFSELRVGYLQNSRIDSQNSYFTNTNPPNILQNLENCSQNKKREVQNFILSQNTNPTFAEFAELTMNKKKVQNLQNSEFVSQNSYTSQTNPTFAEFAELLTKQKRF
jgi:hypothetical protein